jgi:hypothetical protein
MKSVTLEIKVNEHSFDATHIIFFLFILYDLGSPEGVLYNYFPEVSVMMVDDL